MPKFLLNTIEYKSTREYLSKLNVKSITFNANEIPKQFYIMDKKLPYWVIYRNEKIDNLFNKFDYKEIIRLINMEYITSITSTR